MKYNYKENKKNKYDKYRVEKKKLKIIQERK